MKRRTFLETTGCVLMLPALESFGRHAIQLADHLASGDAGDVCGAHAWDAFQGRFSEPILELVSSLVDCPAHAGRCDPLGFKPENIAKRVSSAQYMFSGAVWTGEVWWFLRRSVHRVREIDGADA